jgi:hypothetical protein
MHRATEGLEKRKAARRRGRLVAGGAFLLLFGLTLGVLLTQSLRPRLSEMDPITGDFLTGTGRGGVGGSAGMAGKEHALHLLAQGRTAFERQEWSQAIGSFKALLDIDPNHPEAHTYMGLILARASDADGALLAFDRALSTNPNFPLALWGKGMVLYHDKEEFSLSRATLEKLASMLPAGEERKEIEKIIAEISAATKRKVELPKTAKAPPTSTARISGVVSIDSKLRAKLDGHILFVIARSQDSPTGPPLAVKRFDRPVFPLRYSLGPEDVMRPGVPFTGKVVVSARLDRDGDPTTREAADLAGEYRKNPVEVGSEKVDIMIDQIARR